MGRKRTAITAELVVADGVVLSDHDVRAIREDMFVKSFTLDNTLLKIGEMFMGIAGTIGGAAFTILFVRTITVLVAAGVIGLMGMPLVLTGMFMTGWKKHAANAVFMGQHNTAEINEGV